MTKKFSLVGVSNGSIHAVVDEELLYAALSGIDGLEVEAGMELVVPESAVEGEVESAGYSAYVASASYSGSVESLRDHLRSLPVTETAGLDFAVVPEAITSGEKLLVLLDVDSTLVSQEVIDQLAAGAGRGDAVAAITDAAMRGEIDFERSLRDRVAVLEGQPESLLSEVADSLTFTAGAFVLVRALHNRGHVVGAVSGGFIEILRPLAERIDLDFARANRLEISDGVLTGKLAGEVIDADAKRAALKECAKESGVSKQHVVAVGDGANDELMLGEAAFGIAFNAKPALREVADAQVNVYRLDAVRHFLGL